VKKDEVEEGREEEKKEVQSYSTTVNRWADHITHGKDRIGTTGMVVLPLPIQSW